MTQKKRKPSEIFVPEKEDGYVTLSDDQVTSNVLVSNCMLATPIGHDDYPLLAVCIELMNIIDIDPRLRGLQTEFTLTIDGVWSINTVQADDPMSKQQFTC